MSSNVICHDETFQVFQEHHSKDPFELRLCFFAYQDEQYFRETC